MKKHVVFVRDEVCLRYATSRVVVAGTAKAAVVAVLNAIYGTGIARVFETLRFDSALQHFKYLGIEIAVQDDNFSWKN